jgi:hypothetical protein
MGAGWGAVWAKDEVGRGNACGMRIGQDRIKGIE